VRFYDDLIKGKIVLINMMYVRCAGICPGMTANLLRVQKALSDRVGHDIFMYSITLSPQEDTPEVLKRYAEAYKVKPGWSFLTGKSQDIETLRTKLGFRDPDPALDVKKSEHIGVVRYGNEALARWGATPALSTVKGIVRAIRWMDKSVSPLI
ncbi:MAG: SCO family protein, partial [Pyrinomonadaceae bacterium]